MTSNKFSMWVSGLCFGAMLFEIADGNTIGTAFQCALFFINLVIGARRD